MPSKRKVETWSAVLTPLAAKLNFTSQLASVTLADVLSGETCRPISLADFEGYLTFREYNVENLQFIVWYQNYRKSFLDATENGASHSDGHKIYTPGRASIERRCDAKTNDVDAPMSDHGDITSEKQGSSLSVTVTFPQQQLSPVSDKFDVESQHSDSPSKNFGDDCPTKSSTHVFPEASSDRQECMRIVATFFKPGSSKELNIDAMVKEAILSDVASGHAHPDVFSHAYREVYDMLENISLRNFIINCTMNVNLQKQLYHYIVGMILYSCAIIIATSIIMMVPTQHHPHNRAWRLFAIPFAYTGTTTTWSSFRGFCSQVGGRGNYQLKPWELEEPSDELTSVTVDPMSKRNSRDGSSSPKANGSTNTPRDVVPWADDSINPFDAAPAPTPPGPSKVTSEKTYAIPPFVDSFGQGRISHSFPSFQDDPRLYTRLPRPKVFGPERPVEDPRVKALHSRLCAYLHLMGLSGAIIFGAIIFTVPNGHGR